MIVERRQWEDASAGLHAGGLALVALWGEPGCAHLAVMDRRSHDISVLTLPCPSN